MRFIGLILLVLCCLVSCKNDVENKLTPSKTERHLRHIHDTIGFASLDWQMDSIYKRLGVIDRDNDLAWKAAISPHDDYKYAGQLYYESLRGISADKVVLIGVAHRARNFNLQDKIIFGNFTHWESPYGKLKVSPINQEIINKLEKEMFVIHDSMQTLEHSLEAIVPFLHKKNPNLEIVPILVPYMDYKTIDNISDSLSKIVNVLLKEQDLTFGKDLAVVISNDAVHYGNEDWGANLAPYGVTTKGTQKARQLDIEIIQNCLVNKLTTNKIERFTKYTVQPDNYKEYKWVWCGRYSVPFGLDFANKLNLRINNTPLHGDFIDYQSSIDHDLIEVEDLGMGTTARANQKHWVAYASIKYE
ncbi:AmmeMemoRadiSam system protein B [Flavobacteriaceae bacterium]|jgi:MEMO1 family protein|nr:AmmeMemoRadiSam system protein B [Flavobacteriaceae bacterium]